MRDLAERYQDKKLVVVAINASSPTSADSLDDVRDFAVQNRIVGKGFGVALDGRLAALNYGITSDHTWFLIDKAGRITMRGSGWDEDQQQAVTRKIDLLTGNIPPDFGWRRDIAADFQRAEEAYAAGKMDEALEAIKPIVPLRVLNIEVDYKLVPAQNEQLVRQAVARSVTEWKRMLGKVVEMNVREVKSENLLKRSQEKKSSNEEEPKGKKEPDVRSKPDLKLVFERIVIDPNDEGGLQTTCAVIILMDEREMEASVRQGSGDSPVYVSARIAIGHQGEVHRMEGLAHLVGAAIARALGLDERDDETSITRVGSVDGAAGVKPVLSPSREDMMALGSLISTINLRLGEIYIQQKKFEEARTVLRFVSALGVQPASKKANDYLRDPALNK